MKFNIKFIFIFSFLLLVLILFTPTSQASFNFIFNDVEYSLPDLPDNSSDFDKNHFAIFKNGDNYTLLSFVNFDISTMKICNTNGSQGYMGIVNNDGSPQSIARIVFWNLSADVWKCNSWQPGTGIYQYYGGEERSDKFLYSTDNIYLATGNSKGFTILDDFFFGAVLYQVPTLEKVTELPGIIMGTVKGIIPVSLIVLLMVLLVLLTRSVISRLR